MGKLLSVSFMLLIIIAFSIINRCEPDEKQVKNVQPTENQTKIKVLDDKTVEIETLKGDLAAYKAAFENEREFSEGLKAQYNKLLAAVDKKTVAATAIKTTIHIKDTVQTVVVQNKYNPLYPTYNANFGKAEHYKANVSIGKDTSYINLWVYNNPTIETTFKKEGRFLNKKTVLVTQVTDTNPYLTVDTMLSYVNLPTPKTLQFGLFAEMNGQGRVFTDLGSRNAYQDVLGVFVAREIKNTRVEIKGGKSFIQNTWVGSVGFKFFFSL